MGLSSLDGICPVCVGYGQMPLIKVECILVALNLSPWCHEQPQALHNLLPLFAGQGAEKLGLFIGGKQH